MSAARPLTLRQKILLAAAMFGEGETDFAVEDLVVTAWKLYPESFTLRGHPHPDSSRVQAKIAGSGGLRGLGWLEATDPCRFKVTALGHGVAQELRDLLAGKAAPPPVEALPQAEPVKRARKPSKPPLPPPLRDVVPEPVRSTRERVEERPLRRAARPARARVSPAPPPAPVEASEASLSLRERAALRELVTSATLRKSRRGLALTSADACALWCVPPASPPAEVRRRAASTESLLRRATQCRVEDFADTAYAFELLSLHRLLVSRFPVLLAEETTSADVKGS